MSDPAVMNLTGMSDEEKKVFLAKRFEYIYETSQKFCVERGLAKDLIVSIYKSDTDWAFILKVDAMLESAAKFLLRNGLQICLVKTVFQNELLEDFVDLLPMNGRTSVLKLLDACGLPEYELGFIESVRLVRNAFAHNIEYADFTIIDIIKMRQDKSRLIRFLSSIASYDEAALIVDYENDRTFLRFCIWDSMLRFLVFVYHLGQKGTAVANP